MEVKALSSEEFAKMDDKPLVELSVKYAKELGMDGFTIQEIMKSEQAGSVSEKTNVVEEQGSGHGLSSELLVSNSKRGRNLINISIRVRKKLHEWSL